MLTALCLAITLYSVDSLAAAPETNSSPQANTSLDVVTANLLKGAVFYEQGNHAEAVKWWKIAASQGNPEAQFFLASMYQNGTGVKQNYPEAARLYRLAADRGDAASLVNLGNMYSKGQGVTQNYRESTMLYWLAANQGNKTGQTNVGAAYARGQGVEKNYIEAYKWFLLASDQGDEEASQGLVYLSEIMTSDQLAMAQRLARHWRPSTYWNPQK